MTKSRTVILIVLLPFLCGQILLLSSDMVHIGDASRKIFNLFCRGSLHTHGLRFMIPLFEWPVTLATFFTRDLYSLKYFYDVMILSFGIFSLFLCFLFLPRGKESFIIWPALSFFLTSLPAYFHLDAEHILVSQLFWPFLFLFFLGKRGRYYNGLVILGAVVLWGLYPGSMLLFFLMGIFTKVTDGQGRGLHNFKFWVGLGILRALALPWDDAYDRSSLTDEFNPFRSHGPWGILDYFVIHYPSGVLSLAVILAGIGFLFELSRRSDQRPNSFLRGGPTLLLVAAVIYWLIQLQGEPIEFVKQAFRRLLFYCMPLYVLFFIHWKYYFHRENPLPVFRLILFSSLFLLSLWEMKGWWKGQIGNFYLEVDQKKRGLGQEVRIPLCQKTNNEFCYYYIIQGKEATEWPAFQDDGLRQIDNISRESLETKIQGCALPLGLIHYFDFFGS